MIETVQMIFYTLVALGVLVTIHEFGHFWVARHCGVKVLRFSIGFGPTLWRRQDSRGTEFAVCALPLGGYVKMLDEREGEVAEADLPQTFNRKTVWQRMAIVVAGPIANFVLAIFAYWLVYLGGVQGLAPVVDAVAPGSVAERSGVEVGQEIISVDGEPTPTWQALAEQLVLRIGEEGTIRLEVKYPESSLTYGLEGELKGWQVNVDQPDPIAEFGLELYTPEVLPIADKIVTGGAAERAGLRSGDIIVAADELPMESWSQWVGYVRARPGTAIDLDIERNGERFTLEITPQAVPGDGGETIGQVGMGVAPPQWPESLLREIDYSVFGALAMGLRQTWKTTGMVLDSIKKMAVGIISPKHLSGPITIAKVAGASAKYGFASYVGFLALLSVSLGVLNLLPIPVLDGGHLMYFIVEALKGSPVSEKVQQAGYRLGLFMIVGLMVVALYNDVMRL